MLSPFLPGTAPLLAPDDIAHVIQVALAPAFLLSALATLLNVFSTRLGRVADKVDAAAAPSCSTARWCSPAPRG